MTNEIVPTLSCCLLIPCNLNFPTLAWKNQVLKRSSPKNFKA